MALDGKQRRKLRALGHHLGVVVQVGHEGVTAGVLAALEQALWDHELVKVKLASEDRETRKAQAVELASGTGAEVAQVLGRTVLLYKANPDEPRIEL
jgi:RNA-binding protein